MTGPSLSEQIDRIKQKLVKAKLIDKDCRVFGAGRHRYELNPPASIAEVEALEKKHKIGFPECYRSFVLQVGNGGISYLNSGAGPFYGIYPLGTNMDQLIYQGAVTHLKNACFLHPNMTDIFWDDFMDSLFENNTSDDELDEEYTKIYGGILPIGSQGCSYIHALVLNGPYEGKVINMDVCAQMAPRFSYDNNFLDWYERWLDESISGKLAKSPSWFGYSKRSLD
ncbi:MAG: SMI1/KNR4 family protein [Bacteroidota bacterium]|nr:SMI1/KNR4 family protein [Bacteroidota bacterium]